MMRPALLLFALLAALPAAAEIYSWKDKDGKMHYSDIPPPSGPVKTMEGTVRPPKPATPPAAATDADAQTPAEASKRPKTLAERELEFRQRRAADAEAQANAEKESAAAAERQRGCEQARAQLAALTSGQRIARFNAAGEREMLDDAARAEETERARKQVEQWCE